MSERLQIVVLDDDPTGIQTVHGCLLLTRWRKELLRQGFQHQERFFYVLTNTRAYEPECARRIVREVVHNTLELNREYGRPVIFVSRSDSTLRSHFPVEIDVIARAVAEEDGAPLDAIFMVPAFFEGGRLTVGDVHYVVDGERRLATAQTEYARDSVFGYSTSHLPSYIEEKTGGAVVSGAVRTIPLAMLREDEAASLRAFLRGLSGGGYVVVNAERYSDLERLADQVLAAVHEGKRFAFQSAASAVKALGGVSDKALLGLEVVGRCGPGLFLVGSHVQLTTDQLTRLLCCDGVAGVEVSVRDALRCSESLQDKVVAEIASLWSEGATPAVYTTRGELSFSSGEERLRVGQRISAVLSGIVTRLPDAPSYLVAKGGITSHDILVDGLSVEKATVLGQVLPGVPVIAVPRNGRFGGMPYVIFPGNVGDENALVHVYQKLRTRERGS
ncbi:MAG: four-carbon acid sugar kinase family protein [Candidatus Brocadiae bacterium]|nr:four-carbon acid sugar kinase family protein [Candidatus Brocadiia bacterium]